jgi:hypothetical protein
MVDVGGRPTERDVDFLTRELLDWAERPDSLNLNSFCGQRHIMIRPTSLIQIKDRAGNEQLSEAYDIAKSFLATRREEANSEKLLSDQAYKCNLRVYDAFNKDDWKKEKIFEAGLNTAKEDGNNQKLAEMISQAVKQEPKVKN